MLWAPPWFQKSSPMSAFARLAWLPPSNRIMVAFGSRRVSLPPYPVPPTCRWDTMPYLPEMHQDLSLVARLLHRACFVVSSDTEARKRYIALRCAPRVTIPVWYRSPDERVDIGVCPAESGLQFSSRCFASLWTSCSSCVRSFRRCCCLGGRSRPCPLPA